MYVWGTLLFVLLAPGIFTGLALYENWGVELTVRGIVVLTFLALFVIGTLAVLHHIVDEAVSQGIRERKL